MILVAGATGGLGGLICQRLRDRGESVRALVRPTSTPERVEWLKGLGVEICHGNLRDPVSLETATEGADVVISTVTVIRTAQPGDTFDNTDNAGTRALVDAATRARASQFIFISFAHDRFEESPIVRAKREVEQRLRESGIPYTVLQPSLFMEVWLGPHLGMDATAGTAKIFGSGERPLNYISVRDVAEYAVHCVRNPSVFNRTIELGGPDSVTQRDAVRIFEDAFGKAFQVTHVPEDALVAQWREASDPFAQTFSSLMLGAARGDPTPASALERPFPIPLTSVREFATTLARPTPR